MLTSQEQALSKPSSETPASPQKAGQTVEIATIKAIDSDGYPLIHWPECLSTCPIKALTQIKIGPEHLHKQCTLAFIGGDLAKPVVMGVLYCPSDHPPPSLGENPSAAAKQDNAAQQHSAPVTIQSDDAITLQSGRAKIELHADGRINIQGLQINSQAYGPNKIKGASVKFN